MATLRDILVRRYGYGRDDFGSAGMVRLDCAEGTLCPVPMHDIFTPHRANPAKVVRLGALFRPGQRLTLRGIGRAPTVEVAVLRVSADGLTVRAGENSHEFLPWERLRHALMRPELLIFHDNSAAAPSGENPAKKVAKSLCTGRRLAL